MQNVLPVMCNKSILYLVLTEKEEFIIDLKISSSLRYRSHGVPILILWKGGGREGGRREGERWNFREEVFLKLQTAVGSTDWKYKSKRGNACYPLAADTQPSPHLPHFALKKTVQGKKLP